MAYTFIEFPKWVYSEIKKELVIVKDAVEEALHTTKSKVTSSNAPVQKSKVDDS